MQAYEHYLKRTTEEKRDILALKPKSSNLLKNTLLFILKVVYPYICLNSQLSITYFKICVIIIHNQIFQPCGSRLKNSVALAILQFLFLDFIKRNFIFSMILI